MLTPYFNYILKLTVAWRPQRINQLVDKLHDFVKLQTIDARQAIAYMDNEILNWLHG